MPMLTDEELQRQEETFRTDLHAFLEKYRGYDLGAIMGPIDEVLTEGVIDSAPDLAAVKKYAGLFREGLIVAWLRRQEREQGNV